MMALKSGLMGVGDHVVVYRADASGNSSSRCVSGSLSTMQRIAGCEEGVSEEDASFKEALLREVQ